MTYLSVELWRKRFLKNMEPAKMAAITRTAGRFPPSTRFLPDLSRISRIKLEFFVKQREN